MIIQNVAEIAGTALARNAACDILQHMADLYLFVNVNKDQLHTFNDDPKAFYRFVGLQLLAG